MVQSKPRGPAHARALAAPTMGRCPRLRMLWVTPLMKGPARSVDSSRCVDCTSAMLSGIHPQHARVALDDVAQACLAVHRVQRTAVLLLAATSLCTLRGVEQLANPHPCKGLP